MSLMKEKEEAALSNLKTETSGNGDGSHMNGTLGTILHNHLKSKKSFDFLGWNKLEYNTKEET